MLSARSLSMVAVLLAGTSCGAREHEASLEQGAALGVYASFPLRHGSAFPEMDAAVTVAPPPPFVGEDIFPCIECHDPDFMEVDPTPRELGDPHDTMPEFTHAAHRLWCMDCHDAEDRDLLRLASGQTLPFEEAPQLCGQCHATQHRDWIVGVHGLVNGKWNGPRTMQPCASCHDAHAPQFGSIAPMPGPKKPEVTR